MKRLFSLFSAISVLILPGLSVYSETLPACDKEEILKDWLIQDAGGRPRSVFRATRTMPSSERRLKRCLRKPRMRDCKRN